MQSFIKKCSVVQLLKWRRLDRKQLKSVHIRLSLSNKLGFINDVVPNYNKRSELGNPIQSFCSSSGQCLDFDLIFLVERFFFSRNTFAEHKLIHFFDICILHIRHLVWSFIDVKIENKKRIKKEKEKEINASFTKR